MPPQHSQSAPPPPTPPSRKLQGSHGIAGGKLLKGFGFKPINAKNQDWMDSGLRNKEGEKNKNPRFFFFFLGLQWAEELLGHWILVTTQGLETPISLRKK